jgi:hypothetical protein
VDIGLLGARAADILPHVPKSEWVQLDSAEHAGTCRDQDGQGACVGFSCSKALAAASRQAGYTWPELSAGHLYGRINGGSDRGAMLSDALIELQKNGCCKSSTVGDLDWHKRDWPAEAEREAKSFKIIREIDCPTFEEIADGLQNAKLGVFACDVGNDFECERDGWVHDKRGRRGGHALPALGLAVHPKDGRWGVITQNSWGKDWGVDGFGIVPESYFDGTFNDFWLIEVTSFIEPQGT